MKKLSIIALATFLLALTAGSTVAGHHENSPGKDIVETAVSAGTFNTLVAAVKAAGLVDTLKSDGPFTVFAPNDEAFAKLPAGTLEGLLADPTKLAAILTYHVVPGQTVAADVTAGSIATVQGQSLNVDTSDGVSINNAKVIATDVMTTNGVIHVIDTVLIPHS